MGSTLVVGVVWDTKQNTWFLGCQASLFLTGVGTRLIGRRFLGDCSWILASSNETTRRSSFL